MTRVMGWLGTALILAAIIGFGWFFGSMAEATLNPVLPANWQDRLVPAVAFAGVIYLFWQVEDLKRDVRRLNRRLERLSDRDRSRVAAER